MSGGLLALLDDISTMLSGVAATSAKNVSSASKLGLSRFNDVSVMVRAGAAKSSTIIVDDIPVNTRAIAEQRIEPHRELAVVGKIIKGSLLNKLALTPVALAVSALTPAAPWLMPAILAVGGAYLCYEGAEKILHKFLPHTGEAQDNHGKESSAADVEKRLVSGALKTDIVMSAEIMFMSLGAMATGMGLFWTGAALMAVGAGTTLGIYGLVGGLVKLDDIGLMMQEKRGDSFLAKTARAIGPKLVSVLPHIMKTLSAVGTGAMLYVGGSLMGHALPPVQHLFHAAGHIGSHLPHMLSSIIGGTTTIAAEAAVGLAGGLALIAGLKIARPALAPIQDFLGRARNGFGEKEPAAAVDKSAPAPAPAPPAPSHGIDPSQDIVPAVRAAEHFPAAAQGPRANDNKQLPETPKAQGKREPGGP